MPLLFFFFSFFLLLLVNASVVSKTALRFNTVAAASASAFRLMRLAHTRFYTLVPLKKKKEKKVKDEQEQKKKK